MSERRSNSSAAVSPAGPAPAMTATFERLSLEVVVIILMVSGTSTHLGRPYSRSRVQGAHASAVVEIPVLPRASGRVSNRVKAHVLFRNHKPELRIIAYADQALRGERRISRSFLVRRLVIVSQTRLDFPVRLLQGRHDSRTPSNLECRCAREDHSRRLVRRQVVRPIKCEPCEFTRVVFIGEIDAAGR